ncbi:MAG: hypothetical protein KGI27_01865 [Thaumarchaeota archaeon]|nr:hypothetical protein [Nitrososphaerota archaeon]
MSRQNTTSKSVKVAAITALILAVIIVILLGIPSLTAHHVYSSQVYHKIIIPSGQFTPMPPDPYPALDYHRPVFFMRPGSTAQIYVKYFSTWDYPGMVNIANNLSVYNRTNYKPLSGSLLSVSVDPILIPHKNGENYTVVYSYTAKPDARGIYAMNFFGCYNRGGDVYIAVGLNSLQIRPQDISISTIAAASCHVSGFIENQIIGFVNATVEYKPAIRAP